MHAFVPEAAQLLPRYVKAESGKSNHRAQLLVAIAEARWVGNTLLIIKLDRLSRSVGFIFTPRDAGVHFFCCEISDVNTLTVSLFVVPVQYEHKIISRRTKDAFTVRKDVKLGSSANLIDAARANGRAAM